jgi:hypothetical protein
VNLEKNGPELIISILRDANKPLTIGQLQEEINKLVPSCRSANIIILYFLRIRGTIKGKRADNRSWI